MPKFPISIGDGTWPRAKGREGGMMKNWNHNILRTNLLNQIRIKINKANLLLGKSCGCEKQFGSFSICSSHRKYTQQSHNTEILKVLWIEKEIFHVSALAKKSFEIRRWNETLQNRKRKAITKFRGLVTLWFPWQPLGPHQPWIYFSCYSQHDSHKDILVNRVTIEIMYFDFLGNQGKCIPKL